MVIKKNTIIILVIFLSLFSLTFTQNDDDFNIQDHQQQEQTISQQQVNYDDSTNSQRQMQFLSQKRTACLILSRYYTNQFSQDINGIVKNLTPQDQQKFINKLYATAVQKCQPIITQMQIMQFFTASQSTFDPSPMFYIFDGYNFHQVTLNLDDKMSQNQQGIVKFMKQFDSQMQIKKQQQKAKQIQQQRDEGVEIFFISIKNLPIQLKYIYILIVVLICAAALYWGFDQIGNKPKKSINKRRKKQ